MSKRLILGFIEPVKVIGSKEIDVKARIDTGATSSSMDEELAKKLGLGPVIREKIVKSASGIKTRPTITAKIKIKGLEIEAEFTLADRSHLSYPLLIGQNILKKENFLIDPKKVDQE